MAWMRLRLARSAPARRHPGLCGSTDVRSRAVPATRVAAALVDAGVRICRITGSGEGRGVFCGMGVCQECVMTIDGTPARACMTFVRDGMTVEPLRAGEPLVVPPATHARAGRRSRPNVLVLGAGPARPRRRRRRRRGGRPGRARRRAGEARRAVLQAAVGRRPARRVGARPAVPGRPKPDSPRRAGGRRPCSPASRSGAPTGRPSCSPSTPARSYALRPRRLVLATGAYERGVPLPGWTLPGLHDDGCGADADARLPGASRAPRARLGERPAQRPGGGGDRPRRAARWRRSASSRRSASPLRTRSVARMLASAPDLMRRRACG